MSEEAIIPFSLVYGHSTSLQLLLAIVVPFFIGHC
jgi:hypothetical protein